MISKSISSWSIFFSYFHGVKRHCAGGDLLAQIAKLKTINERDTAKIIRQVLSALDYCHKHHIVHRDIKPENIVLDGPDALGNAIKIIDFGRSKILKPQTKLLELAGSVFFWNEKFKKLYYVAPEIVMNKEYDEKCDIWSVGVILYLLICGRPPFFGQNKDETVKLIKKGDVTYNEPIWKHVSPELKDLISKMLMKSPEKRINAHDARMHHWIIKCTSKTHIPKSKGITTLPLKNLREFYVQDAFQKAVLIFIASHLIDHEYEKNLRELFSECDLDNDGQISRAELREGYRGMTFSKDVAENEIEEIFQNVDLNNNGYIDYNEFLVANLKRVQVSSEKNLREAFAFFDEKNKGFIDIDDLRKIFGGICKEETLKDIMNDIDKNKDQKVFF